MKSSGERYFPDINNSALGSYEPFISYEHWHRYCFAAPFVMGKTVLDIASGEGYGSDYLAERAALVYGIDVCPEAVRHASQTYSRDNLRFLQGSAGAIPLPGQHCLDAIVSFETIEHLDAATQILFAREVKRLLKPDGVLLVSTPNRIVYSHAEESQNRYHLHEFAQQEFVEFLSAYFAHVRLLSQRVYPASIIWNLDASSTTWKEHQLYLEGMRFRPRQTDGKETTYLIAVCSDAAAVQGVDNSLLLDLSEVAFRGVPGREQWHGATLYRDSGSGFRDGELVHERVMYGPDFTVSYQLDPLVTCRQLRWDPLELRLCQVRLRRVAWQDAAGENHELDLSQVSSNGNPLAIGAFRFETSDPMLYLPIKGAVSSVVIEGECLVEGEAASMQGLERLLVRRKEEWAEAQRLKEEWAEAQRLKELAEVQRLKELAEVQRLNELAEAQRLREELAEAQKCLEAYQRRQGRLLRAARQLAPTWLRYTVSRIRQRLHNHPKPERMQATPRESSPPTRKAG